MVHPLPHRLSRNAGLLVVILLVVTLALAGCGRQNQSPTATAPDTPASLEPTQPSPATDDSEPSPEDEEREPSPTAEAATPKPTATPAQADGEPEQVSLGLAEFATGLNQPLFVTHASDDSGRLFVVEKGGTIRLLPDGELFLDISDQVSTGAEQGLLGLAFHPQFEDNGYFYVDYTNTAGDTIVSRFSVDENGAAADPESEALILQVDQPAANHNGGMIGFGPDGYLYIGMGDGGGANDRFGNAQDLQSLLGKMLRIDVDNGDPYGIPPDNPFVANPDARPEIWAYGLRNPWRWSFDSETNDLYIADVGQNRYEWIHFQPADSAGGQNYGWPILEGSQCLEGDDCDRTGLTEPIFDYSHDLGCSIVGGYVYRGADYPALAGHYVFGDFCSGRVWTLARTENGEWTATEQLQIDGQISSFGTDEADEMYMTDLTRGIVYQVTGQ